MQIVDKENKEIKLNVGDLIILKDSHKVEYIGKKRLICRSGATGAYQLVALDVDNALPFKFTSLEEIYENVKDNIVRVVPKNNIKLILE